MAEAKNEGPSFTSRGKVQEVRKQWAVHEDSALAYQIQNEEITEHYGLNRFHRRMVREDIPIAKFVQSEEELQQQEERLKQLEVLKIQAEEDAKMAKQISRRLKQEVRNHGHNEALDDEELAQQLQEKENKKYERHLERKKERKLKKEREILEAALARNLEEARLALNSENGSDQVSASMESLNLQGVNATRVTPSGRIEDGGDFSDFYNLPDEMDEFTRLEIQASQDEELATLLQEQEHKRTKAKVDQEKVRKIELQDEQLARIIQEQEKLRLKKAKQRHQARKEARKQLSAESKPLETSVNSIIQQKHLEQLPSAAVPINSSRHHRYRSNSYTKACDSPPSPPHSPPPQPHIPDTANIDHRQHGTPSSQSAITTNSYNHRNQQHLKTQHVMAQPSSMSVSSPRPAHIGPGGLSTLESARQIAAGNLEGILAVQDSKKTAESQKRRTLQQHTVVSHDGSHIDTFPAHGQRENVSRPARERSDSHRSGGHPEMDPVVYSQPYKLHDGLMGAELQHSYASEVPSLQAHQGDSSNSSANYLHQPSRSGFYTNEEDDPYHDSYPSGLAGFNIAAAIDPTYQRRHPEASFSQETLLTSHIPFSRSLPQADGELEWDPNLRGSLRKTKAQIHSYQDSGAAGSLGRGDTLGGEQVMSAWQPVQGQRRRDSGSRNKPRKHNLSGSDGKANCKQQ